MKFDKETVIKHHFWFLLGTAMPLALVGILILMTVVSAEISKNRKDLETKLNAAKVSDPAKNDEWIREIQKHVEKSKKREKEVWEEAYNFQNTLFTWPEEMQNKHDFDGGLFASEIRVEKTVTPVDPKAEEHNVVKHFSGTIAAISEDEATHVVTM